MSEYVKGMYAGIDGTHAAYREDLLAEVYSAIRTVADVEWHDNQYTLMRAFGILRQHGHLLPKENWGWLRTFETRIENLVEECYRKQFKKYGL